jgi:choline dehydrogenase
VTARREVILSGGAINSPQLLMLSGIGPGNHLAEVGVTTRVDLPGVGANLQDHPVVPLLWYTRGTTDLAQLNNLRNFARWKAFGSGPLSSNVGEAGAFFASRDGLAAPDIQIHAAPSGFYDNGLREPTSRMFTAAPTLVSVQSRGSVRLRSTDPSWHPAIDAAYLEDQTDLDALLAGARHTWDICTHGAVGAYLDRPWNLPSEPSDEDLLEHIRTWAQTLYHPVATCAMGSAEDAAVGPDLKVRGVEGLRVVDASVMPAVPRGNTNAPTIMIAEKAADEIRKSR